MVLRTPQNVHLHSVSWLITVSKQTGAASMPLASNVVINLVKLLFSLGFCLWTKGQSTP